MRIAVLAVLCVGCGSHHPPTRSDDATPEIDAAPDAAAVTTTCWPYDRPPIAALHASPHKVFAHYFAPFPISIDNKPAESDYYATQFLTPGGENGKHLAYGGYLRERPLGQAPRAMGEDYQTENLALEVSRADAIGLDGFTFDLLSAGPNDANWLRLKKLLAVIPTVDPELKVQLVFDMTAAAFGGAGGSDATARAGIATTLAAIGNDPSLMRLPNGRLAVSAFAADVRNAAFWTGVLADANAAGFDLALIPMPVGGWSITPFTGVDLYGASSWGARTVQGAAGLITAAATAHAENLIWMAPVAPQDSRPKDFNFTESNNSAAFRAQWNAAISADADWVQMITWNDYSEDTEISPSSQIGDAFYDLTGYYTTWLKTGAQPPIVRDALYYFHRAHSMDPAIAAPDLTKQTKAFVAVNGAAPSNTIEVVGFLTAPGTLEISVGTTTQTKDVAAGIQAFTVPIEAGTPRFRLLRGDVAVVDLTSATPIDNAITYQDPLYHAGASLSCPTD